MVSNEKLDKCADLWLSLSEDERKKWISRVNGDKMAGFRAFVNDCVSGGRV